MPDATTSTSPAPRDLERADHRHQVAIRLRRHGATGHPHAGNQRTNVRRQNVKCLVRIRQAGRVDQPKTRREIRRSVTLRRSRWPSAAPLRPKHLVPPPWSPTDERSRCSPNKHVKPSAIRELLQLGADPAIISFGGGYPDADVVPTRTARSSVHAGPSSTTGATRLQYTVSNGSPVCAAQIAGRMASEGVTCARTRS